MHSSAVFSIAMHAETRSGNTPNKYDTFEISINGTSYYDTFQILINGPSHYLIYALKKIYML